MMPMRLFVYLHGYAVIEKEKKKRRVNVHFNTRKKCEISIVYRENRIKQQQ